MHACPHPHPHPHLPPSNAVCIFFLIFHVWWWHPVPPSPSTQLRSDTDFLAFLFPRSLGSGFYDEINGGQWKLVRTYLSYISTKFWPIWISFGARISKTPCQTHGYRGMGLAQCFAYACTKTNPNRLKFGGDIAQIGAHQFSLSSTNFVINSTPQGPWEQKGQKTCVSRKLLSLIYSIVTPASEATC